jgi:transposase InsO family protein
MASLQIEEILTAPRNPWQSPYAERLIGSIRRECLDHFIILNARHLKPILVITTGRGLTSGWTSNAHFPAGLGCRIVQISQLGGLYHRYERVAA